MSTDCWVAKPPRTFRPTLPGRSCAAANAMMLSSTSVTIARPSRLRRNLLIDRAGPSLRVSAAARPGGFLSCPSGERGLAQVDLAECVGLVPRDLLRAGREVVVEVREDHRRVVQRDRLELLRILALILQRDGSDVRLRQVVELLVVIVRGVPYTARLERADEEHVRHGPVPPVGDVHRGVEPRRVAPA